MSASKLPIISSTTEKSRKAPARYMSRLISERRNIGPIVGIERTAPTIVAPEIRLGICIPITLIRGLIATRTAYFQMAIRSEELARYEARGAQATEKAFDESREDSRRSLIAVGLGAGLVIMLLLVRAFDIARLAIEGHRVRG